MGKEDLQRKEGREKNPQKNSYRLFLQLNQAQSSYILKIISYSSKNCEELWIVYLSSYYMLTLWL